MMTKATAIAVALCAAGVNARHLNADDGSTCIATSRPKDFIRVWGLELGGDAATDVNALDGLPCDDNWDSFDKDNAPYLEHAVQASMPSVLKEVMAELKLMTGDPNSEVFRCGAEGVKWFTVNDWKGCALKDNQTFQYRGKSYKNTAKSHVDSLAATVSYVCNGQARRRDIGVTYSAIVEDTCE
jgi:hypothetical protein